MLRCAAFTEFRIASSSSSHKMKLATRNLQSFCFLLTACVGTLADANSETDQVNNAKILPLGREVPVSTSTQEIRAQPIGFFSVQSYQSITEPGVVRPSNYQQTYVPQTYPDRYSGSDVAFSRRASREDIHH